MDDGLVDLVRAAREYVRDDERMQISRVYRHWPFLAGTVVCLIVVLGCIGQLVSWAAGHRDVESVVKVILFLVPLFALAAFLVLVWRVRTVVDDTGVTQHWILREYRVLFAEITAIEPEYALRRWFLRVHCGERTYEVIPCHTFLPWELSPPRALVAARIDIERASISIAPS